MVNYLPPPSPGFGGGKSPAVQFENATGQLENQPHNIIHDLVGGRATGQCGRGIMSDPMCAALDPIFWLHHSNIDRLWNQWIALGGGRSDPPDSAWRTQQFRFFDENKQPVTMTPAQVLDTAKQLGYKYDNDPPPVARQRFAPAGAFETVGSSPSDPELVAATESGLTLGSQPVTTRVPLPLPAQAAFEAASNEEDPSRVLLNIEGIQIDDHPGVVYEIYLNLPEGTDPAEADDHFVGYVTFFGAKHHPEGGEGADEHAPAGLKQTYDITPLVDNLKAQGHWTGDSLAVSFVPQGLLPPPEGAESGAFAEEAPEEESLEQPEVRIGRVSIVRE
jgi:tyrosinase